MKIFILFAFCGVALSGGDNCEFSSPGCNCYDIKYDLDLMRSKTCQAGISKGKFHLEASSVWGSSSHSRKVHGSSNARLDKNADSHGNAGWSAEHNQAGEYIEVNLEKVTRVTGVILQGRAGKWKQYVTKFSVQYSQDSISYDNIEYNGKTKIYNGNTDQNSWVVKFFPYPVYAQYIRIVAKEWYNHISLRFEVLTC